MTVDQVEAFHTKCEDTGINKRVIVSSAGFYKTTRKKAERYGIDCLTFAQVETVDWLGQTEMTFRQRDRAACRDEARRSRFDGGQERQLFLSIIDGPDEDAGVRVIVGEGDQFVFEGNAGTLVDRLMKQVPDPTE